MTGLGVYREIRGGGLVGQERVQVICPACGQQVEAMATDGWVRGYCAVARQYVDFPARDRDSRGHFIKGNVPWNKRASNQELTIQPS